MSNYIKNKRNSMKPNIYKSFEKELNDPPNQFCDYISGVSNRFEDISDLYLKGLSMDDVKYMKPDDFINLVPHEHYKHKLLMTILVRRYLFREDDTENIKSGYENACDICNHKCNNPDCSHSCGNYVKIISSD